MTKMRAAGNEDGRVVATPCTACAVWRYLGSLGKFEQRREVIKFHVERTIQVVVWERPWEVGLSIKAKKSSERHGGDSEQGIDETWNGHILNVVR